MRIGIKSDEQQFCLCGCGQPTRRWRDGLWARFVDRHYARWRWEEARPVAERFWDRVHKSDGDGCWNWTGSVGMSGYPTFEENYKQKSGHRWVWEQSNGPIPKGMFICHHCDNPKCVRLDHLFLGTPKDNVTDMVRKGRDSIHGSRNGNARLSEQEAQKVREVFAEGKVSYTRLARQFGISRQAATRIVKLETYRP